MRITIFFTTCGISFQLILLNIQYFNRYLLKILVFLKTSHHSWNILMGELCFKVRGDLIFYKESMKPLKLNIRL